MSFFGVSLESSDESGILAAAWSVSGTKSSSLPSSVSNDGSKFSKSFKIFHHGFIVEQVLGDIFRETVVAGFCIGLRRRVFGMLCGRRWSCGCCRLRFGSRLELNYLWILIFLQFEAPRSLELRSFLGMSLRYVLVVRICCIFVTL